MFKNLTFRSRILLVTVPLIAVLVAAVVTSVQPLFDNAANAQVGLERARIGAASARLLDQLATERDLSVRLLAGGPVDDEGLTEVRERTDARSDEFAEVSVSSPVGTFGEAVSDARGRIDDIAEVRELVDNRTADAQQVFDGYLALTEPFDRLTTGIGLGAVDPEFARAADALANLAVARAATSELRGYVALRLDSATYDTTSFGQTVAYREIINGRIAAFEQKADESSVTALRAVLEDPDVTTSTTQIGEVIRTGSLGTPPAVGADDWFSAMSLRIERLGELSDAIHSQIISRAQELRDSTRRVAYLSLGAAVAGSFMALIAALALGRSLAERLKRISEEAHEIATQRLPEVLVALNNPTAADAARSIPQIEHDSTDEIGVLAESFNGVLRAAVETSIEHSRRRSETLTKILVSLGRRNQALLDQQLDLLDDLESRQEDPEVLEGLFRIDHAMTTMRRNAENLLILAADTTPRPWTDPVPMVDVMRGAAAEVRDMSRVDIRIASDDFTRVTGRMAVDLSHILAELIDNSANYSPPTAPVIVTGEAAGNGYRIWIADSGFGIPGDALAAINARLARPPEVDEIQADQVGFQVVGRLARRVGVQVTLHQKPGGGTAARIDVPAQVLESDGASRPAMGTSMVPAGAPAAVVPATMPISIPAAPDALVGAAPPLAPMPVAATAAATAATTPAGAPEALSGPPPVAALPTPVGSAVTRVPLADLLPTVEVPPPDPLIPATPVAAPPASLFVEARPVTAPPPVAAAPVFAAPIADPPAAPASPMAPPPAPANTSLFKRPEQDAPAAPTPVAASAPVPPPTAAPPPPTPPATAPMPPPPAASSVAPPPPPAAPTAAPPPPPPFTAPEAATTVAPPPADEPTPAPEAAESQVTAAGLLRRARRSSSQPDVAAQVEAGSFRRLPISDAAPVAPSSAEGDADADERRAAMSRLSEGVARGRSLFDRGDDPLAAADPDARVDATEPGANR